MILWFVILGPVLVAEVFRSPMIDYRMVAAGALLPAIDVVFGRALALHTLAGAVGVLAVVMLVTQQRRLVRRRWLGLPIGMFMHDVLDGSWATKELFWWPAFGWDERVPVPEFDRPLVVPIILELTAVAVGWWAWRRYALDAPENRDLLIRTGQLSRKVLS